jgi:poly-gamma-glutamate capsule biosynthesis protein CapA/YwtB (metallophosphatase superfamily)
MVAKNDVSDIIRFLAATLFIIVFFGGAVLVSLFLIGREASKANVADLSKAVGIKEPVKKESITLHFTGDVMLDRGVEYMIDKYGNGDYRFPFLNVAKDLKAADVVFGNLEGPISDKGYKAGSIYSFEVDPAAIEGLRFAGYNVMSCANNHMFDYTRLALEDTLVRLKESGIMCVGLGMNLAEAKEPKFIEMKGNKIAFLAYADFNIPSWLATDARSGYAPLTPRDLKEGIEAARNGGADMVIVSFHFGSEYQPAANEDQKKWARLAIDDGADLVVGHHPHVVEPVEEYQGADLTGALGKIISSENIFKFNFNVADKPAANQRTGWIAYSLGNFVFDQSFSKETMEGGFLEVLADGGKITSIKAHKVTINNRYQPSIVY